MRFPNDTSEWNAFELDEYEAYIESTNLHHFALRAKDSGDWDSHQITETEFRDLLERKINSVNMKYVKDDIRRFIKDQSVLEIWSPEYFHQLVAHLKISEV